MERLPQLSYGLLKDQALRKKLSDLGIPSHGPKPLLIKRHTEWVNLVNANCDSARPRTKKELLSELDIWERSQGRNILNGLGGNETSSVMRKDFDGPAWATSHGNDFQQLIAKARRKPPASKDGPCEKTHDNASDTINSPHFATTESTVTPRRDSDMPVNADPTVTIPSNPANGASSHNTPSVGERHAPLEAPVIELDNQT